MLAAMASGFGPLFWALVFRKQVFVWLHTIFESKQRVNDGAFIASLLETEDTTSTDLMQKAQKLLRRIIANAHCFSPDDERRLRCAAARCLDHFVVRPLHESVLKRIHVAVSFSF